MFDGLWLREQAFWSDLRIPHDLLDADASCKGSVMRWRMASGCPLRQRHEVRRISEIALPCGQNEIGHGWRESSLSFILAMFQLLQGRRLANHARSKQD